MLTLNMIKKYHIKFAAYITKILGISLYFQLVGK